MEPVRREKVHVPEEGRVNVKTITPLKAEDEDWVVDFAFIQVKIRNTTTLLDCTMAKAVVSESEKDRVTETEDQKINSVLWIKKLQFQ
jgi:hypothetical protein